MPAASGRQGRTLTVLLSADGPSQGVLDVLQDMSAMGLVQPFLWASSGDVAPAAVPALEVRAGRLYGTTVQEALVSGSYTRARVGVVVSFVDGRGAVRPSAEQQLARLVASSGGDTVVSRLRFLLVRPDSKADPADVARDGWHNIVLSPEDSAGPGRAHLLLPPEADAVETGRYAAPAIASLAGLWSDTTHAPLDDQAVLPGETVYAARSFYRRLDAGAVEAVLRTEVASTAHGFPLPRLHGTKAVYVDDVLLATSGTANALWGRHAGVLRGPRTQAQVEPARPVTVWAALGMLLGFLKSALRNAPAQWYSAVLTRASSAVAGAVHSAVFGSAPAAYDVVVRGVNANGVPATWRDLGDASGQISALLDDGSRDRRHDPRTDLSALWKDYAAGALTLADAGDRVADLPPVQVGADRGVVRAADDAVPPSDDAFRDVPGHLAALTGTAAVEPFDVLAADALDQRLSRSGEDPNLSLAAGRALESLRSWRHRHQRSYAVQVGQRLGDALTFTAREVQSLLTSLSAASSVPELDAASRSRQLRVAQQVRLLLLVAVGVLVALALAAWASPLSTERAVWWGVATVALWAVCSVLVFARGQRELFRELHRRRTLVAEAEAAKANLRQATRDVKRLSDAYGQFLCWSRVLGALLDSPFGASRPATSRPVAVLHGLPHSVDVGVAEVDDDAVANAAAQLRARVYTTGWLREPWESLLEGAARDLGAPAQELAEDPDLLFSEQGAGSGSLLDQWSQHVTEHGTGSASGELLWSTVVRQLNEQPALTDSLLSRVRSVRAGSSAVEVEEFLDGVGTAQQSGAAGGSGAHPLQLFEADPFSAGALAASRHRVARTVASPSAVGLHRSAVLTQFTDGLPVHDFSFVEGGPDDGGTDDGGADDGDHLTEEDVDPVGFTF